MKSDLDPSAEKIQIIDLTRTLAIAMVMAFHLKPTLPLPSLFFRWGWDHFQRNGEYGVCIFFVISGFLITRIIDLGPGGLTNPGWKWFYARRIGRIVPLFLFSIALGLIFNLIFRDGSKHFNYCFKLPAHPDDPLFWGSLFTATFNWVEAFYAGLWKGLGIHWLIFWSLAVEEQFYLFYPLVLKKLRTRQNITGFLIFIIISAYLWRLGLFLGGEENISVSMRVFIGSFDQIALGALLYLVYKQTRRYFASNQRGCWVLVALGAAIIITNHLATFCIGETLDRVYAPSITAIGLFLLLLGGMNLAFFDSKHLKIFSLPGKYSYGNYLCHISVLYFIHSFLWNLNIVIAFLVYISVATMVSAISYHYFEVPANLFVREHLWAGKNVLKNKGTRNKGFE
jgi:peptidoglycan/LPS O-acetylase OafA/YrhL